MKNPCNSCGYHHYLVGLANQPGGGYHRVHGGKNVEWCVKCNFKAKYLEYVEKGVSGAYYSPSEYCSTSDDVGINFQKEGIK